MSAVQNIKKANGLVSFQNPSLLHLIPICESYTKTEFTETLSTDIIISQHKSETNDFRNLVQTIGNKTQLLAETSTNKSVRFHLLFKQGLITTIPLMYCRTSI